MTISNKFIKRIKDQAKYLEGDMSEYLFKYGLKRGMIALELGSCIGLHARKIANAIYPGKVISLDISHNYVQYQKNKILDKNNNIIVLEGDAHSIPLKDEYCDFAYSRFLIQHVKDPNRVFIEIRRILKNEGTIFIVDTDDYYDTFFPELPYVKDLYTALAKLQELRGGDRYIGRKLYKYLVDAGFRSVNIEIVPTIQMGKKMAEIITKDLIPMFEEENENIVEKNILGRKVFNLAISELRKSVKKQDTFYFGLIFLASGIK